MLSWGNAHFGRLSITPTRLLQLSEWFCLIQHRVISYASCYLVRIIPESMVDSDGKE